MILNVAKKVLKRREGINYRPHQIGRNEKEEKSGWSRFCRKGLAMNALVAKLLNISLAGMLVLPFGYCCDQKLTRGPASETAGNCCHTSDQQPQSPVAATKSCCCQERITATQVTKTRKRAVVTEFPTIGTSVVWNEPARIGVVARLHSPTLSATGSRSAQTLFCVWRL